MLQEAQVQQAQLRMQLEGLERTEAQVQKEQRRCELMAERQEPSVTDDDVQAAFGATVERGDQGADDADDAGSVSHLEVRRGLHQAETMHMELRGQLMQAQVTAAAESEGPEQLEAAAMAAMADQFRAAGIAEAAAEATAEEARAEATAATRAAFGAEWEAEAEARAEAEKARAEAEEEKRAEVEAIWRGHLRRSHARYEPDSKLPPRTSRWGRAQDFLDEAAVGAGDWQNRVADLYDKLQTWPFARRVGFQNYGGANFIRDAHRWNVQCQKLLTRQHALTTTHTTLCADVPERFRSAVGDTVKEINDMVNNHVGEVREIDGAWVRHDGETPKSMVFFNPQYAINWRQWHMHRPGVGSGVTELAELPDHTQDPEGRYCTILAHHQPAIGGAPAFKVRTARVISLAEIFWFWGHEFTARELYAYYVHARRLVLTRPHSDTNPRRREMVQAHHATTGRWGCGRVGKGELVRD